MNENFGAISQVLLDHGMAVYVNFTQAHGRVEFTTWLDNPKNYPYWDYATCLAVIVGTPNLSSEDDTNSNCGFLPTFDEFGKNHHGSYGEQCIKNKILMDPCKDKITVNSNFGSVMHVVPHYEFLASSRFQGLNKIRTTRLDMTDDIRLNPDWHKTIVKQSMLVA